MSARSATVPEVPSLENLPAALGQRIRQLEDQIGAPLFERTTRSVALTRIRGVLARLTS